MGTSAILSEKRQSVGGGRMSVEDAGGQFGGAVPGFGGGAVELTLAGPCGIAAQKGNLDARDHKVTELGRLDRYSIDINEVYRNTACCFFLLIPRPEIHQESTEERFQLMAVLGRTFFLNGSKCSWILELDARKHEHFERTLRIYTPNRPLPKLNVCVDVPHPSASPFFSFA